MMTDQELMQIAIAESEKGDWPYGACIATNAGELVVQGHNSSNEWMDPTAHAEMVVIREAAKQLQTLNFNGYTLYTSSESCPMCASAEIWAGFSRVVYGASIEQLLAVGQPQIRIVSAQVNIATEASGSQSIAPYQLTGGVLAEQAIQVVENWNPTQN